MAAPKSELAVWLEFTRAFVWPATVLIALAMFKGQLRLLLSRISSVKYGEAVVAFQPPAEDAKESPPATKANIVTAGSQTFLSETGVRAAIRDSGHLTAADEIYRAMRIFGTGQQNTWLAFSKEKVFLLLDDATTRRTGRLVQWVLRRDEATPIHARPRGPGVGLIDIGVRRNWLYSTSIFASPEYLKSEIEGAILEGAAPAGSPDPRSPGPLA